MKTALLFVCVSVLAATAQASPFCSPSSPGTWCEQPVGPDAGQLISDAQYTLGIGSLNSIYGEINGTGGADMFAISIPNTAAFTASAAPASGTNIKGDSQAALYLFDSSGHGIEAADDGTALAAFNGSPGIYFVDITGDGNTPEYTMGSNKLAIFAPFTAGQVSMPVSGAGALDNYSGAGCGADCAGGYEINLSGAQFSSAPEPGSLALAGSAISMLGLLCRFRRKAKPVLS